MKMLILEFPNGSIGNFLEFLNNSAELNYSVLIKTYGLDKNDEIG